MQSYYGPGILPPTFFNAGITYGPVPPPYMWGPQNLPPAAFGKPYAAIYPHAGGFLHPFMPPMVNPLNAEPAKSVNSKENSLNKELKEVDGVAVSIGSGNSEKTSGDYSLEGSSGGNNQKASGTPKKRSLDDMTTSGAETCGASAPNDIPGEPGRLATLANVRIPDTAIKPCASTGSYFRVSGTPSTEWPAKDDKESKRERRKQSNRESARRSRLRKQVDQDTLVCQLFRLQKFRGTPFSGKHLYSACKAQVETEDLTTKVELLTAENASLRSEISKLTESSQKLRLENYALMERLKDSAPDQAQEVSVDQTAPAPSARVAKNFLAMMDGAGASRSSSRHMERGAPRLRQFLGSGPPAADAVAASWSASSSPRTDARTRVAW